MQKPLQLAEAATAKQRKLYQEENGMDKKANSYSKSVVASSIADVWDALKNLFEVASRGQLFKICGDVFSFTWNESQDVNMYIAKLKGFGLVWLQFNNDLWELELDALPDLLIMGKTLQKSDMCNYCKMKGHWVRNYRKVLAGKPAKEVQEAKAVLQKLLPIFCEEVNVVQNADATTWWIDNGTRRHIKFYTFFIIKFC